MIVVVFSFFLCFDLFVCSVCFLFVLVFFWGKAVCFVCVWGGGGVKVLYIFFHLA